MTRKMERVVELAMSILDCRDRIAVAERELTSLIGPDLPQPDLIVATILGEAQTAPAPSTPEEK